MTEPSRSCRRHSVALAADYPSSGRDSKIIAIESSGSKSTRCFSPKLRRASTSSSTSSSVWAHAMWNSRSLRQCGASVQATVRSSSLMIDIGLATPTGPKCVKSDSS